jgi:hypothetical protein
MLKTLGAGALSSPLIGPANEWLLGLEGVEGNPINAKVPFSIGNAGVPLMFEVWGWTPPWYFSKRGIENAPTDLHKANELLLADMLKSAKELGATGIEYYVGWGVAEPEEGKWDWSIYKRDARTIKESGYQYIPYVWIQNLPRWVRHNPAYPRASNVETGLYTESLSIFADKTHEAYDRFYAEFAKELGTEVDILRVGTPQEFGETAYPEGNADRAFPTKNNGPGIWVNEPDARAHFKRKMKAKYGSLADLNQAWDTHFASFDSLDYPKNATHKRYWLDFINWYHEALTEETGLLIDIVRQHFPKTPLNINLGFPYEKVNLGQDLTGIAKMCAQKNVCLRTVTGTIVPFLHTKRIATAARHYPPPKFSSEPASGGPLAGIAGALFKDLTTGVNWHFDYPRDAERAKDFLDQYRRLWRGGVYPEVDGALFFPTSAHRLENWDNWRENGWAGGFPEGLRVLAEDLRHSWDYDVVDERLVNDDVLSAYKWLFWPAGNLAEAETLRKICDWIERGGILLVKDLGSITTVEGDKGAFAALLPPSSSAPPAKAGRMIKAGRGLVFDGQGDVDYLMTLIVHRGDLKSVNPDYPPRLTEVVPVDAANEGVLVSQFKDGILVFNKTESAVTTELKYRPGTDKPAYEKLPPKITLPPLAFRWIDGKTGEVI